MDPVGVLQAVVALLVYPGGLFLAAIVWLGGRARPVGDPGRTDTAGLGCLLAADLAASQAPLPASPAVLLPPSAGATPNVAAVMLVLAAAVVLTGGRWESRRVAAGIAAVAALLVPAAGAASLSLPSITGQPGALLLAARGCAAATLLIAGPLVCATPAGRAAWPRLGVLGAIAVIALSLLAPPSVQGWAAVAAVAAIALTTAGYLALTGRLQAALTRRGTAVATLSTLLGAVAIAVAALGAR
jgi:hypothetical protein